MATSFFVSRRSLSRRRSRDAAVADHLFIAMSRSANDATDYFQIRPGGSSRSATQVTI